MCRQFIPLFLLCALLFSCAMPTRTGYDRNIGTWRSVGSNQTATANPDAPSASSKSAANVSTKLGESSLEKIIRPWIGTPYQYGAQSKSGIDCSGFVQIVIEAYKGVRLPRSSAQAYKKGTAVDRDELKPGDVLYFGNFWGVDHAGVWIGDGKFAHASTSVGVTITVLDSDPYWTGRYKGARSYG